MSKTYLNSNFAIPKFYKTSNKATILLNDKLYGAYILVSIDF